MIYKIKGYNNNYGIEGIDAFAVVESINISSSFPAQSYSTNLNVKIFVDSELVREKIEEHLAGGSTSMNSMFSISPIDTMYITNMSNIINMDYKFIDELVTEELEKKNVGVIEKISTMPASV